MRVTREIQDHLDFIVPSEDNAGARRDLRLLDYASGPGMVTHALQSRCREAVAIDISPGMVEKYQRQMESYPIPGLKTESHVGNLFTPVSPTEFQDSQFFNFDVAAVGFGFHHFENPSLCIARLVERLKPGGVILIVDFGLGGGHLPAKAGITSHGFSEEGMHKLYQDAGLVDSKYYRIPGDFSLHMHDQEIKKSVFLARATKPV